MPQQSIVHLVRITHPSPSSVLYSCHPFPSPPPPPNRTGTKPTGLCTAHLVRPSSRADIPLARRGLRINVCFGDFIEAAYPFMERCAWCNAGGYVGSGLSGAIVAVSGVSSSAYIPLPLAVATCNRPLWLAVASSAAFFPAFLSGVSRPLRRVSDNDDDDDDGGVLNKREGCLQ